MKEKAKTTIQNFIEDNSKNVLWIYGKSGYGKTKLASSLIKKFQKKNKKILSTSANKFVNVVVKLFRAQQSIQSLISYCNKYDLVVLDNIDIKLFNKSKTQMEIKNIIFQVINNNKTKFVLISEKRPRKLPALKFQTQHCQYLGLKAPGYRIKADLLKSWARQKKVLISNKAVAIMANATNNLFELKGLFSQFYFNKSKLL